MKQNIKLSEIAMETIEVAGGYLTEETVKEGLFKKRVFYNISFGGESCYTLKLSPYGGRWQVIVKHTDEEYKTSTIVPWRTVDEAALPAIIKIVSDYSKSALTYKQLQGLYEKSTNPDNWIQVTC